MNKSSVLSIVSGDFEIDWNLEVQRLVALRVPIMSQSEIAEKIGVSLRTIQRFENYESHSIKIMYNFNTFLK